MGILQVSRSSIAIAVASGVEVFSKTENVNISCLDDEADDDKTVDFALFSASFKYFAALYSNKKLIVWSTAAGAKSWRKVCVKTVNRRSTSLAFNPEEELIYAADKSGDVCSFSIEDPSTNIKDVEPVLGHVSILLDVAITERYIITADRDEKIRVTRKDRPYVIENFCLGHTEFVCKIQPLGGTNLVSTSGDGTLRVWEMSSGTQLQCFNVTEVEIAKAENNNDDVIQSVPSLVAYCVGMKLLAVACAGTSNAKIDFFNISNEDRLVESYTVAMPKDTQLLDMSFDSFVGDGSIVIYALIKTDEYISVAAYLCSESTYKPTTIDSLDYVNEQLRKYSPSDYHNVQYKDLFKTTIPGHVYESFYKNKNDNFKNCKRSAKRRKVV